ncbi:MAG: UDP-N-acetylmuramoyl-tripeptide--D-alanyl-D-alanine ligase, partial [Candidatus Azotimanducaceae bacterium]
SKLVSPDVALLLNVLPAHIGNFPSMKALRQEKLSIATGITGHGIFVLPESLRSELDQYDFLKTNDTVTFGDKNADVSARIQETVAGMDMEVDVAGTIVNCQVPFSGRERAESVMALFGVCHALGLSLIEVAENLRELPLPNGRGNRIVVDDITIIDDSYNANPASMEMGLRHLQGASGGKGRKIALLGEMLELGELSQSAHRNVSVAAAGIDVVYTFGAGFDDVPFSGSHHHSALVSDLNLDEFARDLKAGDVVLVKGSNRVFWTAGFVTDLQRALGALDNG